MIPAKGESRVGLSRLRGSARARADRSRQQRRAHLAGGREPLPARSRRSSRTAASRPGRVGVEERLRFFIFNGVQEEAPALDYVSADPITAGCRDDQVAGRDRPDAARQRHDARRLQGGPRHAARGHDTGRSAQQHPRRLPRRSARSGGVVAVSFGEYTAFPARQHHAAEAAAKATSSRSTMAAASTAISRTSRARSSSASRPSGRSTSGTSSSARRRRRSRRRSRACRAKRSTRPRAR